LITKETFVAMIQIDTLCGRGESRKNFHRLRAAAALAYCAGLWFPEIMALRRRHWMPQGIPCILVEEAEHRLARTIPASPATMLAMQRYIGAPPARNQDELIFAAGTPLKNDFQRAFRRLASPAASVHRAGDLRASFEERS
jgi:hypothetical protein